MNKAYEHIFFDLDRTLWDFDKNSGEALAEIFDHFNLQSLGVENCDVFNTKYREINDQKWDAYRRGRLRKKELRIQRFTEVLAHFGCHDLALGSRIDRFYVSVSPHKTALFPGTLETLDYLSAKYKMHIITNGFEEVQHIKLKKSGLTRYFDVVMTSERAMARKPDPAVFKLAFAEAGAKANHSIMVGDDLGTDISGARSVWMDQVYFNPNGITHDDDVTHEIERIDQLKTIL